MSGRAAAAERLTQAVIAALATSKTWDAAYKKANKAFDAEQKFGATDSEPSYHLEAVLDAFYGSDDDDDDW